MEVSTSPCAFNGDGCSIDGICFSSWENPNVVVMLVHSSIDTNASLNTGIDIIITLLEFGRLAKAD
jgi:hypothetical protein